MNGESTKAIGIDDLKALLTEKLNDEHLVNDIISIVRREGFWFEQANKARDALYTIAQDPDEGTCKVCEHEGWRSVNDCTEADFMCRNCKADCYCKDCHNASNFLWNFSLEG